jgi:diamine N-acetyltransferase
MGSIFLRAIELDDLERTNKWHNDPELYSTLGTFRYVSRSADEEWLRKKLAYSSMELNLAICRVDDSEHIGNIYLRNIDWTARHAELHIFIGEANQRGKGYGQAAVKLLTDHAIKDLGLLRLYLMVLEDNLSAIKMYEKCGFIIEGKLRHHAFKNGMFKTVLFMGLCAGNTIEEGN